MVYKVVVKDLSRYSCSLCHHATLHHDDYCVLQFTQILSLLRL